MSIFTLLIIAIGAYLFLVREKELDEKEKKEEDQ